MCSLREESQLIFHLRTDPLTEVASSRLDGAYYLPQPLLEDNLRESIAALICKLTVVVEFDLVADQATRHGKHIDLLELGLDLRDIALPILPDGQHDGARLGQLHPQSLELFTVTVAGLCKLDILTDATKA